MRDLEVVIVMEEKAVNYFTKSLPYLKKVYKMEPTDEAIVHGIAAVYYSLNDTEQHIKYYNLYRDLKNSNLITTSIEIFCWKKIGGGFGVVVLLLLVGFIYTFTVVNDAIKSNDKFLNVDQPSLFAINKLKDDLATTHSHMQKWANDESAKQPDWPFKLDAALLLDSVLYSDYSSILKLSERGWKMIRVK